MKQRAAPQARGHLGLASDVPGAPERGEIMADAMDAAKEGYQPVFDEGEIADCAPEVLGGKWQLLVTDNTENNLIGSCVTNTVKLTDVKEYLMTLRRRPTSQGWRCDAIISTDSIGMSPFRCGGKGRGGMACSKP